MLRAVLTLAFIGISVSADGKSKNGIVWYYPVYPNAIRNDIRVTCQPGFTMTGQIKGHRVVCFQRKDAHHVLVATPPSP